MLSTRLTRRAAVVLGVAAASVAMIATAVPAFADRVPVGATGNTTLRLGGPVIRQLQANGCGPLAAAATGNATAISTGAGKIQVTLPITNAVLTEAGGIRIEHADAGFNLSNSCYEITFGSFYIQDFGAPDQSMTLDVLAKNISPDDCCGRDLDFTLDLTNSNFTDTGKALKVRSASLLLADEGAEEFNELTVPGSDGTYGPFTSGEMVGQARTSIRINWSTVAA